MHAHANLSDVYLSELVQSAPAELRRKLSRLVAAKCTLAARVDGCHESQDGRMGQEMRAEIERKMEKLQVWHASD